MNLYEIADNIRQLADLEQDGGFDEDTVRDTLEGLEGDLQAKADSIAKLVKMLDREAAECDLEAIRLKDRAAKLRKRCDSVKDYLHVCMNIADQRYIEHSLFDIRIRKLPPSIQLDEELLPKKWLRERITWAPDKTAIKAAIERGEEIRGATLVTDNERLYIK